MLDIKKAHDSATMETTIKGVDSMERTVTKMVQYVKMVNNLEWAGYDEFEFETVRGWLYRNNREGDELEPDDLTMWADFVRGAGRDTVDNYTIMELVYMYEQTRERLNPEQ